MIQANELRIGNIVWYPGLLPSNEAGYYVRCSSVEIRDCEYRKENWAMKPIPLTPELLEKCGFEKKAQQSYFNTDHYQSPKTGISCHHYKDAEDSKIHYIHEPNICIEITSLHQLQNLYFALTGQELTIKL